MYFVRICSQNTSPGELTITETLTFTKSESVSVETSVSIVAGLTLTIEAGVNWGVVSTLGVEASITSGFTTTSGTVKTEEFQHQIQGSITLQPGQRGLLEVVDYFTRKLLLENYFDFFKIRCAKKRRDLVFCPKSGKTK